MSNGNLRSSESPGQMWPFWTVVSLAGLLLIIYLFAGGGSSGPGISGSTKRTGLIDANNRQKLPEARLMAVSSKFSNLDLETLEGKVVVIHFWATWCGPCRREFPEFAEYTTNNDNDEVIIVPVSVDRTTAPVNQYLYKLKTKFPVYLDEGSLSPKLGVVKIPTTVLIDRSGRIAFKQEGIADWSGDGVPALIEKLTDSYE